MVFDVDEVLGIVDGLDVGLVDRGFDVVDPCAPRRDAAQNLENVSASSFPI